MEPGAATEVVLQLCRRAGRIAVIQLTAQMRILVAVASIDFRAGIDGLGRICKAQLGWTVLRVARGLL